MVNKLNLRDYKQIFYIDSIKGNDEINNGSKNKPFKTLEQLFKSNNDFSKNTLIYLAEGIYKTTLNMFDNENSCDFIIKGKNEKTTLIQAQRIGKSNGYSIGHNTYSLNICNLIYTSNVFDTNTIVISCNLNFYNVLIKNMLYVQYGFFLPENSEINFYNCTKNSFSENFLRMYTGKINLYNCYGAFTSGYKTSQSMWDKENNLIANNPKLNNKYKIIGENNSLYGVYSGHHNWNLSKYLLKQNNQYYSIKQNFYDKEKNIYLPCERNFDKNGIDDLSKLVEEKSIEIEKGKKIEIDQGSLFEFNLNNNIGNIISID